MEPRNLLATDSACSPRGYPSSGKTSRNLNLRWTAHRSSPPCTLNRGNACTFPRGRKLNRSEGLEHGSNGPPSTAENRARYRGISVAAHCRWEEGIAHKEKHHHTEKCSRQCDRRCTGNPPRCLPPVPAAER